MNIFLKYILIGACYIPMGIIIRLFWNKYEDEKVILFQESLINNKNIKKLFIFFGFPIIFNFILLFKYSVPYVPVITISNLIMCGFYTLNLKLNKKNNWENIVLDESIKIASSILIINQIGIIIKKGFIA